MIAYHGSNANFKKFAVSNRLTKRDSTRNNEGMGIYFSTDINVAKSYGKYLYTMEINEAYVLDFRSKMVCKKYVEGIRKHIYEKTKIDIAGYINLSGVVLYAHCGNIAIWGITREIEMLLDSNEHWYELAPSRIERVYQILRGYSKKHLRAYMFNYNIKNTGVIKDVKEDVVRIVKKEVMY